MLTLTQLRYGKGGLQQTDLSIRGDSVVAVSEMVEGCQATLANGHNFHVAEDRETVLTKLLREAAPSTS